MKEDQYEEGYLYIGFDGDPPGNEIKIKLPPTDAEHHAASSANTTHIAAPERDSRSRDTPDYVSYAHYSSNSSGSASMTRPQELRPSYSDDTCHNYAMIGQSFGSADAPDAPSVQYDIWTPWKAAVEQERRKAAVERERNRERTFYASKGNSMNDAGNEWDHDIQHAMWLASKAATKRGPLPSREGDGGRYDYNSGHQEHGLATSWSYRGKIDHSTSDSYNETAEYNEDSRSNRPENGAPSRRYKWDDRDSTIWESNFEQLSQYRRIHGDCKVPKSHKLYSWCAVQQIQHNMKMSSRPNRMTDEREQKLDSINFEWKEHSHGTGPGPGRRNFCWDEMFMQLVSFKQRHGHCDVRQRDKPLGPWVTKQRHYKKLRDKGERTPLTDERERLLRNMDFIWNANNQPSSSDKSANAQVGSKRTHKATSGGIDSRQVEQVDVSTMQVVRTHISVSEAARSMDIHRSRMTRACQAGGRTIGEYLYRYANETKPTRSIEQPSHVANETKPKRSIEPPSHVCFGCNELLPEEAFNYRGQFKNRDPRLASCKACNADPERSLDVNRKRYEFQKGFL